MAATDDHEALLQLSVREENDLLGMHLGVGICEPSDNDLHQ